MQLATFTYASARGWSVDAFPALDSPETLVLVFGSADHTQDLRPFRDVRAAYPRACLLGCSTAGEIVDSSICDETLVVAVARFRRTTLRLAFAETAGDTEQAGVAIAEQLMGPDLRGVFVLSDGHSVNGSGLVRGLNHVLPRNVVVTGGLAGDGARFERTWVLRGGMPITNGVGAVGLYGDHVRVGHGTKGGWDLFGIERRITRAEGNVLYELDGKPALQLYKRYLGDRAAQLPSSALRFPLAVRDHVNKGKQVVRTVLAVDEDANSMTFAGDMPIGAYAQLMHASFDRLVDGAHEAAQMTARVCMEDRRPGHNLSPTLAIAISCVGRRLVLGERCEEELEATLDVLPNGTRQIGFYSYGEIAPYSTGACNLHNQTMTLTTITESCV